MNDDDKFCSQCDFNFNRRRYEFFKCEDISFESFGKWLEDYSDRIEIISIKGNRKYYTSGFIFRKETYAISYISIKYYPNTRGHRYGYCYCQDYDGLLKNGYNSVNKYVDNALNESNPSKVLFDICRHVHYQGGGAREVNCRFAVYEY